MQLKVLFILKFLKNGYMLERMKTDPELEQAMMEHMNRMSMSRENMMDSGMMNP